MKTLINFDYSIVSFYNLDNFFTIAQEIEFVEENVIRILQT